MKSFYINRIDQETGPGRFGHSLKCEFETRGSTFQKICPEFNFSFSIGFRQPLSVNVLRINGLYLDAPFGNYRGRVLNKRLLRCYQKYDVLIFQSQFSCSLYKNIFGATSKPYKIIANGAAAEFCPTGLKHEFGFDRILAASGRWVKHKRIESIIEGFIRYKKKSCRNDGLLIIGNTPLCAQIDRPDIIFTGFVNSGDLATYLRSSDAFISLSWLDNCPNSVVEAAACGLPILTSNNGGTRELLGDDDIIIESEQQYDYSYVDLQKTSSM
jgi:glycosyltransferase involved in cell wall biosynthesis